MLFCTVVSMILKKSGCDPVRGRLFFCCFSLFRYDIIQKQVLKAEGKWLSFAKR